MTTATLRLPKAPAPAVVDTSACSPDAGRHGNIVDFTPFGYCLPACDTWVSNEKSGCAEGEYCSAYIYNADGGVCQADTGPLALASLAGRARPRRRASLASCVNGGRATVQRPV